MSLEMKNYKSYGAMEAEEAEAQLQEQQRQSQPVVLHPFVSTRKLVLYTSMAGGLILVSLLLGVALPLALDPGPKMVEAEGQLMMRDAEGLQQDGQAMSTLQQVQDILTRVPLIDGHNDLAYRILKHAKNQLKNLDLKADLTQLEPWASDPGSHTDLSRLKKGMLGGQFWAAYIPCGTQFHDAVQQTLGQIDIIKRMVAKYSKNFSFVTSHRGILEAHREGRIASLIGLESGHGLDNSLAILRMYYELGVRYVTLTHNCNTPWGDSHSYNEAMHHNGLTEFGKVIVREMNRIGMMIDLSHVSKQVMQQALLESKAPVIFSHSSVYALCNHTRNVPDDVLMQLSENGGIIMVNFGNEFLTCSDDATIDDVAQHINYIRNLIGVDYIGLGADFDGVEKTPYGLEDVSKYPELLTLLMESGNWSVEDIEKLAGKNLIRVLKTVEKVRDTWQAEGVEPFEEWINESDLENNTECLTKSASVNWNPDLEASASEVDLEEFSWAENATELEIPSE